MQTQGSAISGSGLTDPFQAALQRLCTFQHLISEFLDGFLPSFEHFHPSIQLNIKYQEKTKDIFLNCAEISHWLQLHKLHSKSSF